MALMASRQRRSNSSRRPDGLGPEVEPEDPGLGRAAVLVAGDAAHADDLLQPLAGAGQLLGAPDPGVVEEVLGVTQGLDEKVALVLEVVDDEGGAGVGPLSHIGDAGLGEAAFDNDLHGGLEHLLTAGIGNPRQSAVLLRHRSILLRRLTGRPR